MFSSYFMLFATYLDDTFFRGVGGGGGGNMSVYLKMMISLDVTAGIYLQDENKCIGYMSTSYNVCNFSFLNWCIFYIILMPGLIFFSRIK